MGQMAADDCVLDKTTFLFNIREDPHELVNLADSHPVLLSNLQKMLMQARKNRRAAFRPTTTAESRIRLISARVSYAITTASSGHIWKAESAGLWTKNSPSDCRIR